MTDRFREPDDLSEREDPADRDERLYESERDAQAVAETRAEDDQRPEWTGGAA